ncbi:MAG: sigma-70 family RNA polymerase sigma factor [Saprospiraceae bacterium]|nr:sigma-70 family RNA polymerase sigma factor [Saprospiraceae bacterium]MCB9322112.1 sigma-70 family RNA polymerase sigma factor [Lewinellaceae bacterium]
MEVSKKTVSADAMRAEWLEIQAAQQNPAQFRPLYERYYDPIFRFVFRRTADESLSADLCSQVFLKAIQRLDRYTFKGVPFSAWLYRIASNEVAQHFRGNQQQRVVSINDSHVEELANELGAIDDGRQLENMVRLLDDLNPDDLEIIEMRFFEDKPFREIADILQITEANAKMKTYRILGRLKKKLE